MKQAGMLTDAGVCQASAKAGQSHAQITRMRSNPEAGVMDPSRVGHLAHDGEERCDPADGQLLRMDLLHPRSIQLTTFQPSRFLHTAGCQVLPTSEKQAIAQSAVQVRRASSQGGRTVSRTPPTVTMVTYPRHLYPSMVARDLHQNTGIGPHFLPG